MPTNFLRLWAGQTISRFGSAVTTLALPLTAILTLHAGPPQMGFLAAAGTAPYLLAGLPAGVWVDRLRRRPLMIGADLGRAVVLASIPLAAWLGRIGMSQLYAAAFLSGGLTVVFDAAGSAFLPDLLAPERLIEGNARLEISSSSAQLAGPGLGGVLVQALTAPVAILADAISFLGSAFFLALIRGAEEAEQGTRAEEPDPATDRRIGREMREGLAALLGNPSLRALTGAAATFNLFDSALFAVYVLYMTRTLGLRAASIGLIFGLAGSGGLLAAFTAARIARYIGVGRAILAGVVLAAAAELLIAGAAGPMLAVILILLVAETGVELGAGFFRINAVSLRQAITPARLRGRINAGSSVVTTGIQPVGSLLGGLLGTSIGLRPTVIVAAAGTLLAFLWIVFSPLRSLRQIPALATSESTGTR